MLIGGFLMIDLGIAMIVGAFLLPEEARAGLAAGGGAVIFSGALMMYFSWPSRKQVPEGKVKADAYVVDAKLDVGEAVGYRMVEMTLDVHPKGGVPFQVTRKFVADMPRIESGQKFEVYYDPVNPDKVELA